MHLVRLDIDKKNSASQYQVGPLGGGLNAVYSPLASANSILSKFVRNVLFHGQSFTELEDSEFEAIDGSMTWVDASGHLRMIACSGGAPIIPSRFVHSPLHPSDRPIYQDDVDRIRGIGNLFWEGDEEDGRWDDMRSDILALIFCTPLGQVSPEKLWWAASRLGVHATARTQPDEGYQHLKDEERQLLDRLRDGESVDHDRTWWTIERERLLAELTHIARQQSQAAASHPPQAAWDDSQLRQQLAHAEEMIRRWDRRSQWHRRLAEVQSHLKTRSPYRRSAEGSLIPIAEKYLKELTAGAVRQLPPWAIEASYLATDAGESHVDARHSIANRDMASSWMATPWMEREVPSATTRQRRLVDLAIRLAIATTASPRIGRIPMVLEHSLEGFRGEPLEQLLHVLAGVARDGRQILLATQDEFIARRCVAHGGSVARVHENLRYAKPQYVIDSDTDLGLHPVLDRAPVVQYGAETTLDRSSPLNDINRQLAGIAEENQQDAWWHPVPAAPKTSAQPLVYTMNGKKYFLSLESPIEHVPGVSTDVADRFRSIGIHRAVDLMESDASNAAAVAIWDLPTLRRVRSIVDLMCRTPQMRPFDAKVLVACGIDSARTLRGVQAQELARRVDRFLSSESGRLLWRTGSDSERARLRHWLDTTLAASPSQVSKEDYAVLRSQKKKRKVSKLRRRPVEQHIVAPVVERRFHLELASPVVDAPSIGTRMAERLAAVNVITVGDLIAAEAKDIATALADKNVSAQVVAEWQQQTMLVCRIPNLRGQDAQLLVAAGYSTAELVAAADPESLYEAVTKVAQSRLGQRFLRGGNPPDAARTAQWILWAQKCRGVRAA
ncbi:MAG: DUF4332 domain-containing protein [Pirellula sp.]|jgi:hypothetical protein|nr:DUF4332 domain-containing protein [Pirellula sp.]